MTTTYNQTNPEKCLDTRATIKAMVRYISDNRRIAKYCGVTEAFVRRVRAGLSSSEDCNKRPVSRCARLMDSDESEKGAGEYQAWKRKAISANDKFVAALGRVQHG